MPRAHGRAGGTLRLQLTAKLLVLVAATGILWLVFWLLSLPSFLALVAATAGVLYLALEDKEIRSSLHATHRGYEGERIVGRALEALPHGWRVFHDVYIGGENADHVVVGPGGAFSIEVKNYAGRVVAKPNGLITHGKYNDKVVKQAWRASHKLREELGLDVQPVLVFIGPVEGDRAGRLPVTTPDRLVRLLLSYPAALDYEPARRAWSMLEHKVTPTRSRVPGARRS